MRRLQHRQPLPERAHRPVQQAEHSGFKGIGPYIHAWTYWGNMVRLTAMLKDKVEALLTMLVDQGVVTELKPWHAWYAKEDQAPAGYATTYSNNFTL